MNWTINWKLTRRILFYVAFALAALIVFLYVRFPSDLFREIAAAKGSDLYPGAALSVEQISPDFPPGLRLEKTVLWFNDRPEANIRAEAISVRPDWGKLFSGQAFLDLDMRAYGGTAYGQANLGGLFSPRGPSSGTLKFQSLFVQNVAYLKQALGREITGKLRGSLTYGHSGKAAAAGSGRLDFRIANGTYPLQEKVLGIDRIDFSEIEGLVTWAEKTLTVERINLTGEKVRSAVKGYILLNPDDFQNSQLNLTARIELRAQTPQKASVTITGTLMNPVIGISKP